MMHYICENGAQIVRIHNDKVSCKYKVVQIWPGQTVTCLHTNRPGHIWTTLYFQWLAPYTLIETEKKRTN